MAAPIGKDLTGKVAVVTGASSGIGAASARLFAEAGAKVVVGYNKGADRAKAVVESLAGKVVSEACFSGNSNCPNGATSQIGAGAGVPCTYAARACRHGTHVAGIAAGKRFAGMAAPQFGGIAPDASIIAIQVFSRFTGSSCLGAGEDPCALSFTSDQVAGLDRVFAIRASFSIASTKSRLSARMANPITSPWAPQPKQWKKDLSSTT